MNSYALRRITCGWLGKALALVVLLGTLGFSARASAQCTAVFWMDGNAYSGLYQSGSTFSLTYNDAQQTMFMAAPKITGTIDHGSTFVSDNAGIVSVQTFGLLTLQGGGTTTITATTSGGCVATATVVVNPKALTITANNISRPYGQSNPTLTASYSGFVSGESASNLLTQPALVTTATATSPPGTYPIIASGASSPNYTIGYATGTLTITAPVAPTVAAKSVTTAYNAAASIDLSGSITGVGVTGISIGTAPTHGAVSVSGEMVTYTPSTGFHGSDSFTYTATNPGGTSAQAMVSITVGQPGAPTAVAKSISTPYNMATAIDLSGSIIGVDITAVTISTAPAHGTLSVSGETVTYTPSPTYYGGSDSFTYTATNPGGTSSAAMVTITVGPLAAPTVANKSVTMPYNTTASIDLSGLITGASITAVTIGTGPAHGTVSVSGETVTYTPSTGFYGADSFTYTATNPGGTSALATASISVSAPTITLSPSTLPTMMEGNPYSAAFTTTGGAAPYTYAVTSGSLPGGLMLSASGELVGLPASSGTYHFTVTVTDSSSGSGPYNRSHAYDLTVAARPDPSKDAEVLGLLNAQENTVRRFARGQIGNIQSRLETLHDGRASSGFHNGLTLNATDEINPLYSSMRKLQTGLNHGYLLASTDPAMGLRQKMPDSTRSATPQGSVDTIQNDSRGPISIWTAGAVNFGKLDSQGNQGSQRFTTSGITLGMDTPIATDMVAGVSVGLAHDSTNIGNNGSHLTADGYSLSFYASYWPSKAFYLDSLIGYQWLSLNSRRYVTANGNRVSGDRDGGQLFGSLALGYEYRHHHLLLSPYGRLDLASAALDSYTESGDAVYALHYGSQTVHTSTGSLGLRIERDFVRHFGTITPMARVEYRHDFEGDSSIRLRYANTPNGELYRTSYDNTATNHALLGLGVQLQSHGWGLDMEYQKQMDSQVQSDQTIRLKIHYSF